MFLIDGATFAVSRLASARHSIRLSIGSRPLKQSLWSAMYIDDYRAGMRICRRVFTLRQPRCRMLSVSSTYFLALNGFLD